MSHSSEVMRRREDVRYCVSPHPNPLPRGEGTVGRSRSLFKCASGTHRAAHCDEPADRSSSAPGRGPQERNRSAITGKAMKFIVHLNSISVD